MSLTGANTTPLGRLHPILAAKQQGSPTPGIKRDAGNANFDGKSLFDTTVHYYTKISYVQDFYFLCVEKSAIGDTRLFYHTPDKFNYLFRLEVQNSNVFRGFELDQEIRRKRKTCSIIVLF